MSAQVIELNIRPAKIVLDWVHNPAGNGDWSLNTATDFEQSAGTVPDMFCQAIQDAQSLQDVADGMDKAYGWGSFYGSTFEHFEIDHEGVYTDLTPLFDAAEELRELHKNPQAIIDNYGTLDTYLEHASLKASTQFGGMGHIHYIDAQDAVKGERARLYWEIDPSLFPLIRLKGGPGGDRFTCFVYEYGIVAIQDDRYPLAWKVGRFD
jgi:hypothetical protein